jgi:hypothetical protein
LLAGSKNKTVVLILADPEKPVKTSLGPIKSGNSRGGLYGGIAAGSAVLLIGAAVVAARRRQQQQQQMRRRQEVSGETSEVGGVGDAV